jgi:hypothetical protein
LNNLQGLFPLDSDFGCEHRLSWHYRKFCVQLNSLLHAFTQQIFPSSVALSCTLTKMSSHYPVSYSCFFLSFLFFPFWFKTLVIIKNIKKVGVKTLFAWTELTTSIFFNTFFFVMFAFYLIIIVWFYKINIQSKIK